ncbi:hypothetical protein TSOC_010232, partial [Tetrabaena socialis]
NARAPRRAATAASADFAWNAGGGVVVSGGGPNPWEAVLDAAPATRYGTTQHRGGGGGGGASLQLLLPSGSSLESMLAYEHRLMSYLQPVSGPTGAAARAAASPSRAPPPPHAHANGHGAGGGGGQRGPQGPQSPAGADGGGGGTTAPPLIPRSAVSTALAAPAAGAEPPWGGAGLPSGVHAATAELRGGAVAGAGAATGAPAAAAAGEWAYDEGGGPLTLGRLITGRPSGRRQLQLMADWLDGTIGVLWEQHLAAAAAAAAAVAASGRPVEAAAMLPPPPQLFATLGSGGGVNGGGGAEGSTGEGGVGVGGGAGGGGKVALAARFGNVSAGLRELSGHLYGVAVAQPQLWAGMVEATAAVASLVVSHVAQGCWEEGSLLARLWNLHTALMDSGLAAARTNNAQLASKSAEQAAKIR